VQRHGVVVTVGVLMIELVLVPGHQSVRTFRTWVHGSPWLEGTSVDAAEAEEVSVWA
jgi:hypothetical protein